MSFSHWFSGTGAKPAVVLPEKELPRNGQNGHPVTFRTDPVYPLVTDPNVAVAAEHFGVLRTRVLNAHAKSGLRSVLITSPQKEEGKSLVCVNLAISLGQLERHRVLLVDGDLRVKGVTRLLGLESETGIGEYLDGRVGFEDCIRPTSISSVWIAAVGQVGEESLPALLEGPRWPKFMEEAKQRFDLIIVDSVPVAAPIADFELLATPCDSVLLIVHLRKTTREALTQTAAQLDGKLLGVIINNTQPRFGFDYYTYYNRKKL